MKPYKVFLEYSKKKVITVVAENEREAERVALDQSNNFITISELQVEVDAQNYDEEEE